MTVVGPDLVLCGAARAGTTFFASLLGSHPGIDPGAVKEPDFFSRHRDRGPQWYDSLYEPRANGLIRLDASASYTYDLFPWAIENVADASPDALVVYAVREPLRRLLSHFQLHRDYFRNDPSPTLGQALRTQQVYTGASDYARWLDVLFTTFPAERVVVVPFDAITGRPEQVVAHVLSKLGLNSTAVRTSDETSEHRHQVVEFRHESLRRARRLVVRSRLYPLVRSAVGPDRMRSLRARMTKEKVLETVPSALATCDQQQLADLEGLYSTAQRAVAAALEIQDAREHLTWASVWSAGCPAGASPALSEALSMHPPSIDGASVL